MVRNKIASLLLGMALSLGAASMAVAQNATAAGTEVINTITLSYNGADNSGTVVRVDLPATPDMTETFIVARKIDLSITANQAAQVLEVAPGQLAATIAFTLENLGNAKTAASPAQDFHITVANTGTLAGGATPVALIYSASVTSDPGTFYILVDGAIYDRDTPTPVSLLPGNLATIEVVANIPGTSTDGLADVFTVTAIAVDSGTKVTEVRDADLDVQQVVFADAASTSAMVGGTASLDPEFNGEAKAETRMIISAPQLTATKTAVVLDEGLGSFDCEFGTGTATPASAPRAPIPGACVEYTITVTNDAAATASATAVTISDVLPGDVTFAGVSTVAYTGTAGGATTTEPANASGTVSATIGTLPAGTTATFTIRVTVD